jgi:hypothetical protein
MLCNNTFYFGEVGFLASCHNPQLGGPGYPFLSESSSSTSPASEALLVATLLPAQLSGSFDHISLTNMTKYTNLQGANHFSLGKKSRYQSNRKLGMPQSLSQCFGEEKYLLPLPIFVPQIVQPIPWSLY